MKRLIWVLALTLALCLCAAGFAEEAARTVDPRLEAFLETWSCDQHAIEIWQEEDGSLSAYALNSVGEYEDYRWDYTGLTFDAEAGTLVCDGKGVKTRNVHSDTTEETHVEDLATGLSATFAIDENDQLLWSESGENAGEGLHFDRLDVAEAEMGEARELRLGASQFVVIVPEAYVPGDLTEEDIADDQVGYYYSPDSDMDFDVFQFPKAGHEEKLSTYVLDEAAQFGNVSSVKTDDEINGIPVGWYRATDRFEDQDYEVLVYLMDDGDSYVKVEFWLDGEDAEGQVDAIIQTLKTIELKEVRLGSSPYFLRVLKSYELGDMSEEDIADDQVAYFASDESLVDFDVYQFSKEGFSQELAQYVLDEAAMYDKATEIDTQYVINGIPIAWYRTPATYEDREYDTLTCILDNDTEYVEVVFWLDGANAQEEVNAIVKSLSKVQAQQVELGGSGYMVTLPDGFRKGEIKDSDTAIGHLAFYYDVDDTLEIDVYQYSKADMDGYIGTYLEGLSKEDPEVLTYDVNAAINDIPVAWCRYEAEFNGDAFKTISYFLDTGEQYVEVSFWLKGENSEAAAEEIINTLKAQ